MQPYTIVEEGPRGGLKKTSVVDVWMTHPLRAHIDAVQTRPDQPRPTFTEDGLTVYNRYWPPAHPTSGGEIATVRRPSSRGLFPDAAEREWFWHWLAHKARRPWVPMVAVIMVAEEFGSGRGTLFDILELLFGEDYVVPCTFGELTGKSAAARFNDRLANALIATVNEADRRRRASAGAAAAHLRGAEERHRAVADGAAALRGEGAARLRAALGADPRSSRPSIATW